MHPRLFVALAVALSSIGLFALATGLGRAAHPEFLACEQPQNTGATTVNVLLGCWAKIGRPADDTSATRVQLGVHFPLSFPGIAQFVASHGFRCTQDDVAGQKRLSCFGTPPLGGIAQVDFTLHAVGQCGTSVPISAVVANPYGVSGTIFHTIHFPACPAPAPTPKPIPPIPVPPKPVPPMPKPPNPWCPPKPRPWSSSSPATTTQSWNPWVNW